MNSSLFINSIIFNIGPFLLLLKQLDDLKNYKIIATEVNYKSKIIYLITPILFCFYILCLLLLLFRLDFIPANVSRVILFSACITGILKRHFKLYNSIEEIYEAFVELAIIISIVDSTLNSTYIVCLSVLFSSVSAGISKLKSKLWTSNNTGMIQFLTLPSVTRRWVRKYSSILYMNNTNFSKIINLMTFFTPWFQIISVLGVILGGLFNLELVFYISIGFQFVFALLLFFIADLSWITSFYFWLLIVICSVNPSNFDFYSAPTLLSLTFVFFLFLRLFLYKIVIKSKLADRITSLIAFDCVPFQMFTEAHMNNILTHYFDLGKIELGLNINAFNSSNGSRSNRQNLSSRHLQALMYPLGDFFILVSKTRSYKINYFSDIYLEDNLFKSDLHKSQIIRLFQYISNGKIEFYQHIYINEIASYRNIKLGSIILNNFSRLNNSIDFNLYLKPHQTYR